MTGPVTVIIMQKSMWDNLGYKIRGLSDLNADTSVPFSYLNLRVILATNIKKDEILVK